MTPERQNRDSDLVLVFGLGPSGLPDRKAPARVMFFDPEGVRHENLAPGLEVTSNWNELDDVVAREVVYGTCPNPTVAIAPGYARRFPAEMERFQGCVAAARLRRASDDKTRLEKGRLFLSHLAANSRPLAELPPATGLAGRLSARPGFIVGSGPGLDGNGRYLKEVADRGWILAAGSALKPLLAMGVRPDMVVVLESDDTSEYLAAGIDLPGCLLASASVSHPAHFGMKEFLQTSFHLTPGAAYLFDTEEFVPQAGTAGSAAFVLGLMLGLNPLVLVGQDMAFAPDRIHAVGTPGEEAIAEQGFYTVTSVDGSRVRTHSAFASSLHWYAESVKYIHGRDPNRLVINANESGARIPGAVEAPLSEVVGHLRTRRSPESLASVWPKLPRPALAAVRANIDQCLSLMKTMAALRRRQPETADRELALVREKHPFLKEALANLTLGGAGVWEATRELEHFLTIMKEGLN